MGKRIDWNKVLKESNGPKKRPADQGQSSLVSDIMSAVANAEQAYQLDRMSAIMAGTMAGIINAQLLTMSEEDRGSQAEALAESLTHSFEFLLQEFGKGLDDADKIVGELGERGLVPDRAPSEKIQEFRSAYQQDAVSDMQETLGGVRTVVAEGIRNGHVDAAELCRHIKRPFSGFRNAVLKAIDTGKPQQLLNEHIPFADGVPAPLRSPSMLETTDMDSNDNPCGPTPFTNVFPASTTFGGDQPLTGTTGQASEDSSPAGLTFDNVVDIWNKQIREGGDS